MMPGISSSRVSVAAFATNVIHYSGVEIHKSARRHGVDDEDIRHALDHPIVVVDLESEAGAPRLLVIGPGRAGNFLEVIVLELADEYLAIHAMALRKRYRSLLPGESDE